MILRLGDNSPPWYANLPFAADLAFEANDPTSNWNVFLQSVGLAPGSTMVHSSQAQFNAPAAPQTAPAMTAWTPDQLAEAEAQKAVQSAQDTSYLQDLIAGGGSDTPAAAPSSGVPGWVWIVLAAVVGFLLLKGGRRR